jgi:hypothetical protein
LGLSFYDIAEPMVLRGEPQIRIRPQSKIAFDLNWPALATTDVSILSGWSKETPDANAASVAKAVIGGYWFWEVDSTKAIRRMEEETGKKLSDYFRVRSSPGKGHFHFKQSAKSIAMGNISQGFVIGNDWSARVSEQYVISPGSLHPTTGKPYEIISDRPIVEAPDWLIDWLISQKLDKKKIADANSSEPIPQSARNDSLASIGGGLRYKGLVYEEIQGVLQRINAERCQPPLPESEVETIARSVSRYEVGKEGVVVSGTKKPTGMILPSGQTVVSAPPEIETAGLMPRPVFPLWAIQNTSLFDGLIAPTLKTSSKQPQFIFLPAVQLFLNYLYGRVSIKNQDVNLNMFVGLISPPGHFFKGSSCELAHKYFEYAAVSVTHTSGMRNAEGKIVIIQAGSTEGFGKTMLSVTSGSGIRRAVLFNDELSQCVAKIGIENSSFASSILSWYGSANWGNNTLNSKNSFSFPAKSYCFSWLWCTTDRGFNRQWAKIAGLASGMEDRLFFVLSPKVAAETQVYSDPECQLGALRTRQVLDAAIKKEVYSFENLDEAREILRGMNPRSMQLLQMLALYFAVDLEEDYITTDCVEKAKALVTYRDDVRTFLDPIEADNQQGRLQKEILREVKQAGGKIKYRELCRDMDYLRFGGEWERAWKSLTGSKELVQWEERTEANRLAKWVGIPKRYEDE